MSKLKYFIIAFSAFLFSCKESTTYQLLVYNDTAEQVKLKVYSPLALQKDSIVLNVNQQYELYYSAEDGTGAVFNCSNQLDSAFAYTTVKRKIPLKNPAVWDQATNDANGGTQYKCTLNLSLGDTIQ